MSDHIRDSPNLSFARWTDLASRSVGGAVIWASDEFFGEKESLIRDESPTFSPSTFGHKGQIVDGWETRRRRSGSGIEGADHDAAIIRLGIPGVVREVTVDTAFFVGNFPTHASVEAAVLDGIPSVADVLGADWQQIVPLSALTGDSKNHFATVGPAASRRFTHVRLNQFPDGGISRFRVHGEAVPDPAFLTGLPVDLAALRNGGRVVAASNMFFSAPENMIKPGESRVMGEGWETARRRDGDRDWIEVSLAAQGELHVVEIDTANYLGNHPETCVLLGSDADAPTDAADWFEVLPKTRLLADFCHRFRIDAPRPVRHLRLEIHPDGGIARLHAFGTLTDAGRTAVETRWKETR